MACFSRLTGALLIGTVLAGCGADARSEDPAPQQSTRSEDPANDGSGAADAPEGAPDVQTPDEAVEPDLDALAEAWGWTLEEAREAGRRAVDFDDLLELIYERRPEIFVGAAIGNRLYIKGEADAFLLELVEAAPFGVAIVDGQPYSFDENDERGAELVRLLASLGFATVAGGADILRESVLEVSVERTPGAPDTVEAILAALPVKFQTGVEITISDEPVVTLD